MNTPKQNNETIKTALLSISTGTLSIVPFLAGWFSLTRLPSEEAFLWMNYYYYEMRYIHVDYIAALFILVIVSLLSAYLVREQGSHFKFRNIVFNIILCVLLVLNLNMIRQNIYPIFSRETLTAYPLVSAFVALAGLAIVFHYRRLLIKALRILTITVAPLFVVAVMNAGTAITELKPKEMSPFVYERPLAPLKEKNRVKKPRVVWIIFDELDQKLTFEARPADVDMSEFDKFLKTGFSAQRAFSPAQMTEKSVPALTTGRMVMEDSLLPGERIDLLFKGETKRKFWSEAQSIFQKVHEAKGNVAILAHGGPPYCRLFHKYSNLCWEHGREWSGEPRTVIDGMGRVAKQVALYTPFLRRRVDRQSRRKHPNPFANVYLEFAEAVDRALKDPRHDFLYVHWMLPHLPVFFDRVKDQFHPPSLSNQTPADGYLHNLELTSLTLKRMRTALEKSGLWHETAVIISADHSCRETFCGALEFLKLKQDKRVPFLVKLPGQNQAASYGGRIKTVNTLKLIEAIQSRKKLTPDMIPDIMKP